MITLILLIVLSLAFTAFPMDFIKGADISWVPGQEKNGTVFLDTLGNKRDILDILKNDYQINTIRLRVFVNPSSDWGNGLCDINATVEMAKRVKQANMMLMLTLHYSDSWADPAKQNPPAQWKNLTAPELAASVYKHTKDVMTALAAHDIYPVLVQTGNETNNGMLVPLGEASSNMKNYAMFVSEGYKAVKEISPTTLTVVHISNGFDESLFNWNIGGLTNNNAQFDVIGMSSYPEYASNTTVNDWADFNKRVLANINKLVSAFNKPVIIAETGMHYTAENQCREMIADLLVKLRSVKNNMGLGVLYWEPQAFPGYNRGYNLGAWNANGKPTSALKGFIEISSYANPLCQQNKNYSPNICITPLTNGIRINLPQMFFGTAFGLYRANGKLVYKNIYSGQTDIELSRGVYLLKVNSLKQQALSKSVIVK